MPRLVEQRLSRGYPSINSSLLIIKLAAKESVNSMLGILVEQSERHKKKELPTKWSDTKKKLIKEEEQERII